MEEDHRIAYLLSTSMCWVGWVSCCSSTHARTPCELLLATHLKRVIGRGDGCGKNNRFCVGINHLHQKEVEKGIIQPISTGRLRYRCLCTPRLLRSGLLRVTKLVLRYDFLLDRLSAVLRSKRSYPAMLMAEQLVHQRFTIPGPLVQRNASLNLNHPKKIGTVLPLGALNPTHVPL